MRRSRAGIDYGKTFEIPTGYWPSSAMSMLQPMLASARSMVSSVELDAFGQKAAERIRGFRSAVETGEFPGNAVVADMTSEETEKLLDALDK